MRDEADAQRPPTIRPERWTDAPHSPRQLPRYVRFRIDPGDGPLQGLFHGCHEIAESVGTPAYVRRVILDEFRWFNRCLRVPPRFINPAAVFWFDFDSGEMLSHAWRLVSAAQGLGHTVLLEKTHKPGISVYRDEHQIAAIRFSDSLSIQESSMIADRLGRERPDPSWFEED